MTAINHGFHAASMSVHLAPYINAIIILAGVKLSLDWLNEDMFIEVSPFHAKKSLKAALCAADALGLEPLEPDESGDGDVLHSDGTIRIYLAMKEPNHAPLFGEIWPDMAS